MPSESNFQLGGRFSFLHTVQKPPYTTVLKSSQVADYLCEIVILKQANGGDAGGTGLKACGCVVEGDATKG